MGSDELKEILQHPGIWQGALSGSQSVVPSGHPWLEEHLPGGGWPTKALTEILIDHYGIGELRLLIPALSHLTKDDREGVGRSDDRTARWIAWIDPPYIPYAPALVEGGVDISRVLMVHPRSTRDSWWAVEQALRSGTCAAVLAWIDQADERCLRRLQLAAEAGESWGVLFRSPEALCQASPAALRLRLIAAEDGLDVRIVKNRGGRVGTGVELLNDRY